ncbi:MAG: sulfotransferase [Planctomycetota bacterium]
MSTIASSTSVSTGLTNPVALHAQPTFIVGSVRSGTTLLRLMLDHHPRIAFHFEFEFAVDQVGADGSFPSIKDYHDYLSQHRVFLLSGGEIDERLDFSQLVNSFLEQKRSREGKQIVGATVHHHIDRIPHVWPEAKYVHLLRDGRDVARSCSAMGWAGNMYHAVDRWIDAEHTWEQLKPTIPEERRIEVRYEDLIADTEETLARICDFLGTQFDPQIYDYAKTSTYDLPDAQLIEQWRRKLTDEQIQLAESRIAEMLTERGYPLSGLPRITVSSAEKKRLAMQDRLWRARFRMRRYGLPLFATDYVARRLPLESLRRSCLDKINDIDNSHIR